MSHLIHILCSFLSIQQVRIEELEDENDKLYSNNQQLLSRDSDVEEMELERETEYLYAQVGLGPYPKRLVPAPIVGLPYKYPPRHPNPPTHGLSHH